MEGEEVEGDYVEGYDQILVSADQEKYKLRFQFDSFANLRCF